MINMSTFLKIVHIKNILNNLNNNSYLMIENI